MVGIIIIDEKPSSCDMCPFQQEFMEEATRPGVDAFEFVTGCPFDNVDYDKCPLIILPIEEIEAIEQKYKENGQNEEHLSS